MRKNEVKGILSLFGSIFAEDVGGGVFAWIHEEEKLVVEDANSFEGGDLVLFFVEGADADDDHDGVGSGLHLLDILIGLFLKVIH